MSISKKILFMVCFFLLSYFAYKIYDIRFNNNDYYLNLYNNATTKYVYGLDAKRGKILDINGNVLIDNKEILVVTYRKNSKISVDEEIDLAYSYSKLLDMFEEATVDELKKFYLLTNDANYLLSKDEINDLKYRRLNDKDVYSLKYNRIDTEVKQYNLKDRIAIHTYYLMNKDYYYETKVLKENVGKDICASILENKSIGLNCEYKYERVNNYGVLNTIYGSLGYIDKDSSNDYLKKGYSLNDKIGISGLEKYYEDSLRGVKAKYKVNSDNTITLIEEEKIGEDLTLALDIDLELKILEIQKEEMSKASKYKHTENFNTNYLVVSEPKTGMIKAISGLEMNKVGDNIYYNDVSSQIILSSYTVGSVVKGASNTVGYYNDVIKTGKKINDDCVKLYGVPKKCSFKKLGYIDDISSLKTSSNYYQFITAIGVSGNKYSYNMKLEVDNDDFEKYRSIFRMYGLGSSTNIDFYKENIGITGKNISSDLYLNLAIGQYDTYSVLQLLNYINTIGNDGVRDALSFKYKNSEEINKIPIDIEYLRRIQEGFYQVINGGTANGYVDKTLNAVGKTGTAEAYLDGKTIAINSAFVGYLNKDDPTYSLVVLSPNISIENDKDTYVAPVTRYITNKVSKLLGTK